LYPVLSRKNVTLLVNTHVDRLTFSGNQGDRRRRSAAHQAHAASRPRLK
jgi:hypothetical protein